MIQIKTALLSADYECISKLAQTIWHEHYTSILSIEQIDYMLKKFNSVKSIKQQINAGNLYYYMTYNNTIAGYSAIKLENDYIYISKLYILKGFRGKKIAKTTLEFAESMAKSKKMKTMKLHVNKFNSNSIIFYEKQGFIKSESTIKSIGNGFVMDDYLMEKIIL